jgi:hypothetical protein
MNDDTIIKQRVSGRSVRAIAKTNGCSVAEVNRTRAASRRTAVAYCSAARPS